MRLWIEMVLLFFALPVAIAYWVNQVADYLMPLLGAVGIACLAVLLADKQFKRFRLWHWQDFFTHLRTTLKMFIPWACLLAAVVYLIKPELFLQWPLQEPELWMLTLLIYPIVSVIPQEIIFRTFFFHRYKQIVFFL